MQVVFTIPDGIAAQVVQDVCDGFGYRAVLEDGTPNPETPTAFAKRQWRQMLVNWVRDYRISKLAEAARAAAVVDPSVTPGIS